jgi:hypothetical protein
MLPFTLIELQNTVQRVAHADEIEDRSEELRALADLLRAAEAALGVVVALERKVGRSWESVGACVGLTKQGAQQRWGRPPERRPGELPGQLRAL